MMHRNRGKTNKNSNKTFSKLKSQWKYELKNFSYMYLLPSNGKDWKEIYANSYFPKSIGPLTLLFIRLIFSIPYWVLFGRDMDFVASGRDNTTYFLYLTIWNFLLTMVFCTNLTFLSLFGYFTQNENDKSPGNPYKYKRLLKPWMIFTDILTSCALTLNFVVVSVYWVLLAPISYVPLTFDNFFKHLITLPIVFILFGISKFPFYWWSITYVIIAGVAYIINLVAVWLAQVQLAGEPGVVYPPINFNDSPVLAAIVVFLIVVIAIIFHVVVYVLLGWYKNQLTNKQENTPQAYQTELHDISMA